MYPLVPLKSFLGQIPLISNTKLAPVVKNFVKEDFDLQGLKDLNDVIVMVIEHNPELISFLKEDGELSLNWTQDFIDPLIDKTDIDAILANSVEIINKNKEYDPNVVTLLNTSGGKFGVELAAGQNVAETSANVSSLWNQTLHLSNQTMVLVQSTVKATVVVAEMSFYLTLIYDGTTGLIKSKYCTCKEAKPIFFCGACLNLTSGVCGYLALFSRKLAFLRIAAPIFGAVGFGCRKGAEHVIAEAEKLERKTFFGV